MVRDNLKESVRAGLKERVPQGDYKLNKSIEGMSIEEGESAAKGLNTLRGMVVL